MKTPAERFVRYDLKGNSPAQNLLPDGQHIIVDYANSTLTMISSTGEWLQNERFTDHKFDILMCLIELHPAYAPHECLLSAHTGKSVSACRDMLVSAYNTYHNADGVLRPLRNAISSMRVHLALYGLDARNIQETGYLLKKRGSSTNQ